jgi:SecD/SecF fusion protein
VQSIAGTAKPVPGPAKPPSEPAGKDQPAPKSQSRSDRAPLTWLASSDPSSVLLALAEPAGKSAPEKAAAEKPAGKPPEKPAAKAPEEPAEKPPEKAAEEAAAKATAASAPAPVVPTPAAQPAAPKPAAPPARFAGGTEATLEFKQKMRREAVEQIIRAELEARGESATMVDFDVTNAEYREGDPTKYNNWDLRISLPKEKAQSFLTTMEERLRNSPHFPSSNTIGGSVAQGTRIQAVYAIIVSNLLIMLYLWVRFQRLSFGIAAIVALVHDVLVALGCLALSAYLAPVFNAIGLRFLLLEPFKIGMTEVAAFLTIVGYSVSDTVVVFDRIREVRGKAPDVTPEIINTSINQTLSRTLLTSLTAWGSCVVLYFLGGPTIHGFAFSIIIGIITGTYSSIFVAAPLLLVGQKHAPVKTPLGRNDRSERPPQPRSRSAERGS